VDGVLSDAKAAVDVLRWRWHTRTGCALSTTANLELYLTSVPAFFCCVPPVRQGLVQLGLRSLDELVGQQLPAFTCT
jgi:hypothetical protein